MRELLRVSLLVDDLPEIAEIGPNPVLVRPAGRGEVALDARVRVQRSPWRRRLAAPVCDLRMGQCRPFASVGRRAHPAIVEAEGAIPAAGKTMERDDSGLPVFTDDPSATRRLSPLSGCDLFESP